MVAPARGENFLTCCEGEEHFQARCVGCSPCGLEAQKAKTKMFRGQILTLIFGLGNPLGTSNVMGAFPKFQRLPIATRPKQRFGNIRVPPKYNKILYHTSG